MLSAARTALLLVLAAATACTAELDLVLGGGTVIDGNGSGGVRADVGVRGGVVTAIGDLSARAAVERIDVTGHVVAPGFVDPHTHARGTLFEVPTADNLIRQGITTVVDGNDGNSPLDLAAFFDSLATIGGSAPNVALFVGHGTVRRSVIGDDDRAPTGEEMAAMRALVAGGMADGALGLSTGLFYLPGSFAETEEVIELARVAANAGGIYASHMRNEDVRVLESVRETIRIAQEAAIPVHISHHKVGGHENFGASRETLALMRDARANGVDITFDQYPYTASSTGLSSIIPRWAQAGGGLEIRLADPAARRRVLADIEAFVEMRFASDPSKIQLVSCRFDEASAPSFPASMAGLTLGDVLARRDTTPTPTTIAELILEIDSAGGCGAIFHAFDEEDVERLMRSEYGMIGSDGSLVQFGRASPHPRGYGTYPRVLGEYSRNRNVISLEEAIRRMTSAPADRMGLEGRGRIEVGATADLVVFDPAHVIDRATFDDPHQYPDGIPHVFVGGVAVVRDGEVTGARPGVALRGPGFVPPGED